MSAVGVICNVRGLLLLKSCGASTVILKNANQRWAEGLRDWFMTSPGADWLIKRRHFVLSHTHSIGLRDCPAITPQTLRICPNWQSIPYVVHYF
jgi:hypothetical protein